MDSRKECWSLQFYTGSKVPKICILWFSQTDKLVQKMVQKALHLELVILLLLLFKLFFILKKVNN